MHVDPTNDDTDSVDYDKVETTVTQVLPKTSSGTVGSSAAMSQGQFTIII